ncbi:MAG: EpsG family protein [Clostridia bacterium]|nr:EpsG family protein [Clostridia bacterium]
MCSGFIILSVIMLSTFAALRGLSVGTDVTVYLEEAFTGAESISLQSFLKKWNNNDVMFYTGVWIVRQITSNIHVYFFLHQFCSATIIYYIAHKNMTEHNDPFTLYIFMYLMMWYGTTFNVLRQTMAVNILLLGYTFLRNKQWIKYCIVVAIASLFHASVLLALFFPFVMVLAGRKNRNLYDAVLGVGGIIVMALLPVFFNIINTFGTFDRYKRFFTNKKFSETNFNIHFFIIKSVILIGLLFFVYWTKSHRKTEISLLSKLMILDLVAYCASMQVKYGYRLSYIFLAFQIIAIPKIYSEIKNDKNRRLFVLFIAISMLMYFYWRYSKIGYDGIVPYVFMTNDSVGVME